MLITIDGRCGLGKTTIGTLVADGLGFQFLSTGILIRYAAYCLHRDLQRGGRAEDLLPGVVASVRMEDALTTDSALLRSDELTRYFNLITAEPYLSELYRLTREYCKGRNMVLDGRDTFDVFPDADLLYYFEAPLEQRVSIMMQSKGLPREECLRYFQERDAAERDIRVPYERLKTLNPLELGIRETVRSIEADANAIMR